MLGVAFCHHARFDQRVMEGATARDAMPIFLLNSHGNDSYITAEQHALQQLSCLGAALLVSIILIEVILKRFFK
ncbi:hypothetical protein [Dyella silvatica]|uniref:hypothetical protein n=1 Tax=Dyella silvatica TaxID=2992128 RepID=UPI00225111A0|nr:hypothetical protein [Dyella silvatica]